MKKEKVFALQSLVCPATSALLPSQFVLHVLHGFRAKGDDLLVQQVRIARVTVALGELVLLEELQQLFPTLFLQVQLPLVHLLVEAQTRLNLGRQGNTRKQEVEQQVQHPYLHTINTQLQMRLPNDV